MGVLRGLEQRQEQNPEQLIRDTRTLGQRTGDFLKNPTAMAITLVMLGVTGFVLPVLADIVFIIGVIAFIAAFTRKYTLPFRMPLRANLLDHTDLNPSSHKPKRSSGIYFLGNNIG